LTYFLTQLALRPHNEPPLSIDQADDAENASRNRESDYPPSLSASTPNRGVNGAANSMIGGSSDAPNRNPESDSFLYIETLLESLAVLGKLGSGLDSVAQRLPVEIYALVEATVDEVGERMEFGKGLSLVVSGAAAGATGRPSSMYVFASVDDFGAEPTTLPVSQKSAVLGPHRLRLASLEASSKASDHEVLKDLFWTLYSKLDAVMQGLRVIYEVANRIGSVRRFKAVAESTHSCTVIPNSDGISRTLLAPNLAHCSLWVKFGRLFKSRYFASTVLAHDWLLIHPPIASQGPHVAAGVPH
jgi:exocyst complex component 4